MYSRRLLFHFSNKCNTMLFNYIKRQRTLHSFRLEINDTPSLNLTNTLQYSSNSPLKCWNCNYLYKSELFCSKCKAIQEPPENLTFFDIMDIPENYEIENAKLHNKYRDLQKLFHPDKFSNKSQKERELSENLSSLVNKAYSTLTHPLKRGFYMLKLHDIWISEETDNVNSEFLMEIMEKNEQIDDAANDKDKIIQLTEENEAMLNVLSKEVAHAFHNKDLKKAEAVLVQMKYYDTINNRLKNMKRDLGIVT